MSQSQSSSPFDEEAFLAATTEEEGSTTLTPIPAGDYRATIESVKARPWTSKDGLKSGKSIDIAFRVQDDTKEIENTIGRPPVLTQGYFTELDASGRLDYSKGKNVNLMRVRAACGQNVAGRAWNPKHLEGQALNITVILDPQKDSDVIYNRVKSVSELH